jgi:hypothetical protein
MWLVGPTPAEHRPKYVYTPTRESDDRLVMTLPLLALALIKRAAVTSL